MGGSKKSWKTMRNRTPGIKASYTRHRKEGAKRAASKVKREQWKTEKVELLKKWAMEALPDTCIVCGDCRCFVQQDHHIERNAKTKVKLCANCHDTLRRSKDINDLEEAHRIGSCFQKKP